ncbi:MAG: DNA internalization-related competence protein ComEC/Rec2 [Candidatus Poribacteria bacterium]|nr:DNA internalization-related competence protein ComEC/Rec2 [Candidatus Poribacteria bacterium]
MTRKPRPALYFLIPFLLGILISSYTSIPMLWLWLCVLICLIGSILARIRTKYLCYVLLHIAVFACGIVRLEITTVPSIPSHFFDQPVSFIGKTVYQPERGEKWEAGYAVGQVQLLSEPSQTVSAKFLIRFQELIPLRYGKHITLTGVLRQPDTRRNPGGFDYRAYLARQNVSGIIYHQGLLDTDKQFGFPPLHWIETLHLKTLRWIEALRLKTEKIIEDTYYKNALHVKLLKAILLGKRSEVPTETLDIFRNSGTIHVLVISGQHMGTIAALCYFVLWVFRIPYKTRCFLTISGVFIFACMVGFRPSVSRALLMITLYLFAKIIDRDVDIFNVLAVAALTLLLINPMQLWDIGFQLSFVAVASIVYLVPKMEKPFRKLWEPPESGDVPTFLKYKNIAVKWLVLSYLATFAAVLGTGPLIAFYFYRAYPFGIIVSPFAILLVTQIVMVGWILICVGFVWLPLAKLLAFVNHFLLTILVGPLRIFETEWGVMKIAPPTFGLIVVYIAICLGITHWRYVYKQWKVASLIGLSVVAMWIWDSAFHEKGRLLEVVTLDVGQGDATIVKFPDKRTMLIDGGIQHSYYDEKRERKVEYDVGERIIEPYLDAHGIRKLDLVMLTHPDIDHGGGLAYILQNFKVKHLLGIPDRKLDSQIHQRLRSIAKTQDTPYSFPYIGEIKLTPTATLNLLHPIDAASTDLMDTDKNNDSLVLKLSYGEVDILFTGDIEAKAETQLVASRQDLRSEIIKVPHHGSRTSSSTMFIDAVQPRYAIFSLGQRNRFQFPHTEVVARYRERNCVQLRTDQLGAITLKTDGVRCWFRYTVMPDRIYIISN